MANFFTTIGAFAAARLLPAVILIVIGILAINILQSILKAALSKTKLDPQLTKLLLGVVAPVLYVILGLIAADKLGIDVTSIVALASVLTLAISLSLQSALGNIFGGFTLLYTKPFTAGDFVEIAGQSGTVKEVGLAYTRLTTVDNKLISIPNSAVVAAEIVNYTVTGTRRLDITVTAAYSAKPEDVIAALLAAAEIPQVLADPAPHAGVTDYGESSVAYVLQVWTASADYWPAKFAILNSLKSIFAQRGVEMSYPHVNVHMIQD